ncbi:MAG: hypothetical protein NBV67_06640 [Tagaea sp.]|nr:hypothetical protein [Tagaea sp.]
MRRAAGLALALALGACAAPNERAAAPAGAVAPPPVAAPAPNAQAAPAPQIAAAPPVAGARALVGMTRDALGERLGQAGFVRRDGPAEVWRYRGRDCLLDVFVYRQADGGQRVTHIDARTLQGRPASADPCLDSLERERRPQS